MLEDATTVEDEGTALDVEAGVGLGTAGLPASAEA